MNKFLKKAEGFVTSRGFSAGVVTAIVVALVIVANVIIYTLTSLFNLSFSSPVVRDYSVSGVTDAMFAAAEEKGEKVTITFCMAEEDLEVHSTGRYVLATARSYAERYSFVELRFINLLTQMDEDGRLVKNLSKYKKDMRGNDTELRTHSVIFEHEGGNYRVLTDAYSSAGFADFFNLNSSGVAYAYSGEEIIGAMISWVLQRNDERKTAYFTENHGETVDVSFGNLLTAAGYYIDTVNLRTVGEVPEDAALLVISNPISDFERGAGVYTELECLENYLKNGNGGTGGRLYVALDPYSERLENLEGLLAEYGIGLMGGDGEYGYVRDMVLDPSEAIATDSMSFIASFGEGEVAKRLVSCFEKYNTGKVLLSQVSRLALDSSKGAEALLLSSTTSRAMRGGEVVDEDGRYAVAAYSSRSEGEGSLSEIFVVPSILMTNSDIMVSGGYSNRDFSYALLSEIFGADTAVYGVKSVIYDSGIVENLTQRTATVFTVILIAIPVLLAVVGAVVVIRRKRR